MHKRLVNTVHWSVRDIQIRSRKLNEQIIQVMNEAHVAFVTLTEIREQVNRKEIDIKIAEPYLTAALAANELAKTECEKMIAERAKLLEPYLSPVITKE